MQTVYSALSELRNQKSHSTWRWPPVNQRTIGEMELVPSAVGPNPIEQRFQIAEVRTLRGGFQRRGTRLWGLEIPKRTRPEGPLRSRPEGQKNYGFARSIIRKRQRARHEKTFPHCPPAAQAKRIDLVDPSPQASARRPEKRTYFFFTLSFHHS